MKHGKHSLLKDVSLALAGTLAFAGSSWAAVEPSAAVATPPAATPSAAPPAAQQIDELEEVNGGRLYDRIVRAEDRFFKLYNELNKDDDFDTNCANVPIGDDSRVEQRFCMPSFFADAKAEQVRLSQYCLSLTSRNEDGDITAQGTCYEPPSAEVIFFARKDAYVNNVLKVIGADPRLKQMADEVESLHREREKLSHRYDDLKAQQVSAAGDKNKYRPTVR
jgi:hypothetical protein